MQQIVRGFGLVALLACSSPLLAEDLTVSAVKAFMAKIDDATAGCDVDAVVGHVAELAMITLNINENGGMRILRLNKSKYGEFLTILCSAGDLNYRYARTNEKISIDGDQAVITADVAETMVVEGREITAKSRARVTVESIDGKLMLTQLVSTQTL